MKDPPEAVQEKIAFIFNNLSQLNMQTKCEEIKDVLLEEYWPWFAQYLVMKRATIEFNFHFLYINFLDAVKINEINRLVTLETFRNIKVLLRSDKIVSNFSDRSLLKNLGKFLFGNFRRLKVYRKLRYTFACFMTTIKFYSSLLFLSTFSFFFG